MAYYMIQQQPATVNPHEVLLSSGFGNASQSIPGSAYQTTVYVYTNTYKQKPNQKPRPLLRNPPANTTAQNVTATFQEIETSSIPVKCKADPNCNVTKAEKRDMDRHYRTSHKAYAASKGILTEETPCGFDGCDSTFTRKDNLLKHWKKYHGYEQPSN
ncbi:unnamed protein product [Fusarium equiseti]|uniref:C2H2-type domain-containing protein n=1 Tax=Fusarium equiseti TaxID=61235 RepID=A0A8J2J640_FUSEQ|nr:unnamed protein product [Fusarium equiseti]